MRFFQSVNRTTKIIACAAACATSCYMGYCFAQDLDWQHPILGKAIGAAFFWQGICVLLSSFAPPRAPAPISDAFAQISDMITLHLGTDTVDAFLDAVGRPRQPAA